MVRCSRTREVRTRGLASVGNVGRAEAIRSPNEGERRGWSLARLVSPAYPAKGISRPGEASKMKSAMPLAVSRAPIIDQ